MNSFLTVVVLLLIHLADAQSNLTDASNDYVGWAPSCPGRSTMDIIWSCVSVLLVCSYKCLHLNISSFEENEAGWHKTKLFGFQVPYFPRWPLVRKSLRKIKWMFIILIAPEFGVGIAVDQFMAAREELRVAKENFPEESENLTLTHGFYSIMGGYAMSRKPTPKASGASEGEPKDSPELRELYPAPGALGPRKQDSVGSISQSGGEQQLNSESLVEVKDEEHGTSLANVNKVLETLLKYTDEKLIALDLSAYTRVCKLQPYPNPIATEESLKDRSKSDAFTKLFTIIQSIWLVLQSIARVSAGLPITPLELATMAYVLCAIIMYGFWWFKPFGAEHVIIMSRTKQDSLEGWKRKKQLSEESWARIADVGGKDWQNGSLFIRRAMFYGTATAFSAIHLAAWNWVFPSYAVRIAWRVFAIGATASGPWIIFCLAMLNRVESGIFDDLLTFLTWTGFCVYVPSRLGIIVLIVYSFSSMPAAIYSTVHWTNYLPHLG